MFVSVLRAVVKLKLIWQPYVMFIHSKAPVIPSSPVLSRYHTSASPQPFFFFSAPSLLSSDYSTVFFLLYNRTLLCFCVQLSSPQSSPSTCPFCFCEATHHISCLESYMSPPGMCWWLSFSRPFMCASYAALGGMGCSWSKSICHMSEICWVHRFMSRFCGSSSVLSLITVLVCSKWPQRSTTVIQAIYWKEEYQHYWYIFKSDPLQVFFKTGNITWGISYLLS